jgi:hypothetical protein
MHHATSTWNDRIPNKGRPVNAEKSLGDVLLLALHCQSGNIFALHAARLWALRG